MADIVHTRMTAAEFAALPESNLPTELINGEVIMTAAPSDVHQVQVYSMAKLIERVAPQGKVRLAPNDVYLDDNNVVQPDVFWISPDNARCTLGPDSHWHGPPDLIIEVLSPGSLHSDKVDKFRLYERIGVIEYWIVEPLARYVEVWGLEGGKYQHQGTFGAEESFVSAVLGGATVNLAEAFGGK